MTCEARGATHGEEDVVAWREHEGEWYTFCSKPCAEAFDSFPAAYVEHPLPRPAPSARVVTLEGEEVDLGDLRGELTLVDFWATWCKPCVKAMPELGELHEEWGDEGLAVLGVSIDQDAGEVVPKFLEKKKVRYPVALDTTDRPAWHAFHVAAIPAMFLIDAEGNIVDEWKGAVDLEEVRRQVETRLAVSSAE